MLLDKCKSRMEGWVNNTLSFAGRIELIKTVLHGVAACYSFKYQFQHVRNWRNYLLIFCGKAKYMPVAGLIYANQKKKVGT